MRAVWIDEGNDPQYEKLKANGIECFYFAANDPRLNAQYLDAVAAHGVKVGIYAAWNWDDYTPAEFALYVDTRLRAIGSWLNPWVCLDIETHDTKWILSAFAEWRKRRPTRKTDWTLEPMQGGLFSRDAVWEISHHLIGICPQFYGGQMQPFAADRVAIDLLARGFSLLALQGMYDAAALPLEWSGYAYTQGRLP